MPIVVVPADTEELRAKAFALRHAVFVEEQRVPVELERDEHDAAAFHVVALVRAEGQPDEAAPERAAEEAGFARRRAKAEPTHTNGPGGLHPPGMNDGASCVGTGRLVRQADGVGRVGRMAVDGAFRRRGIGDRVLEALEARARADGLREIELHAQCYVEAFYRQHGYARAGAEFEEAGIAHVVMRKRL